MKTLLLIVGLAMLAMGLIWTGQGLGWIMWPQESFMLAQTQWAWYGGAMAIAGLALIVWSRRR